MPLTFSSLAEFHVAHPARRASAEVDYGRPWRTVRFGPTYPLKRRYGWALAG